MVTSVIFFFTNKRNHASFVLVVYYYYKNKIKFTIKTILRKSWIALNRVRKTHTIISVIESGKVSSNENIAQNP